MTMMSLTQTGQPVSNGFCVDVSRGERVGRVSSEWFSRPEDERYLNLTDLHDALRRRPDPYGGEPRGEGGGKPRQCRAASTIGAGTLRTDSADTLEFWAVLRACRRAIILS